MADVLGSVGSIFRTLAKPSQVFSRLPLPGWAQSLISPTSPAGVFINLLQLQGDTPQRPLNEQRRPVAPAYGLYGARTDQFGRYAPAQYRYSFRGAPPPEAPPPASDLNSSLYGGPQAGQVTPPIPPAGPGVISNGAGVPAQRQNVIDRSLSQEVLNAAQQYAAPTNVPLSAFYEGQQQLGRSMMQQGNLVSELQRLGAAPGMTPENLKAWAQQNPGLAYREFLRLKQK